jgi:hypothetical protein
MVSLRADFGHRGNGGQPAFTRGGFFAEFGHRGNGDQPEFTRVSLRSLATEVTEVNRSLPERVSEEFGHRGNVGQPEFTRESF